MLPLAADAVSAGGAAESGRDAEAERVVPTNERREACAGPRGKKRADEWSTNRWRVFGV